MDLGIIQVTSNLEDGHPRHGLMLERVIPSCIKASNQNYVLVAPRESLLTQLVNDLGGKSIIYPGWDVDKMRKFRLGMQNITTEWVGIFDDDIVPDEEWYKNMSEFLKDKEPGQYGFRLTNDRGERHEHGEDWMQFPSMSLQLPHRPLDYNIETGVVEDSPTAYVANSIVHRDVLEQVEPFGLFGNAPDVMWSFAIRKCGFPIGFNPKARAYHVGDRKDNRKK